MPRSLPWTLLTKSLALICGVLVAAVLFQLAGRLLALCPPDLRAALAAGWSEVWNILGPVIGPAAGIAIICAVVWIVLSSTHHRR